MKTTIDDLMKDGWKELLEFGFGRKTIIYARGNERLLYDMINQERGVTYTFENKKQVREEMR